MAEQLDLFKPEDEDRSVISISTRTPWVPPAIEGLEVEVIREEPAVDTDAVRLIEIVLKDMREGLVRGCAIMVWAEQEQCFRTVCTLPHDGTPRSSVDPAVYSKEAFSWVGALSLLKENLLDVAFTCGGYDEELEDEG